MAKAADIAELIVPNKEADFKEGQMMMQDMKKENTELMANMSEVSKIVNELSNKNFELNESFQKLKYQYN